MERSIPAVVETIPCSSALELLRRLDPLEGEFSQGFVFRGHARSEWRLVPSVLRGRMVEGEYDGTWDARHEPWGDPQVEREYVREFVVAADRQGIDLPDEEEDERTMTISTATAVAQHHGVPTRLIDWTLTPYTACYFAAAGNLDQRADAEGQRPSFAVWVTRWFDCERWFSTANRTTDDEPVPSLRYRLRLAFPSFRLASNPNMRAQKGALMIASAHGTSEAEAQARAEAAIPTPGPHGGYPPAVRPGPGFLGPVGRFPVLLPLSIDGMIETILPTMDLTKLSPEPFETVFRKLTLPAEEAVPMLDLLDRIGINGSTMFPGLDGAARLARERGARGGALSIARRERERNVAPPEWT